MPKAHLLSIILLSCSTGLGGLVADHEVGLVSIQGKAVCYSRSGYSLNYVVFTDVSSCGSATVENLVWENDFECWPFDPTLPEQIQTMLQEDSKYSLLDGRVFFATLISEEPRVTQFAMPTTLSPSIDVAARLDRLTRLPEVRRFLMTGTQAR